MKCSNIEAMSGNSKLAKMAWSGSLTLTFVPRFINNDYVTAEITYSLHMHVTMYSRGHGLLVI